MDKLKIKEDELFRYVEYKEHIRTDYPGRYMYGETCVGYVYDSESELNDFMQILSELVYPDEDDSLVAFRKISESRKEDSMGLSRIAYWNDIQVFT